MEEDFWAKYSQMKVEIGQKVWIPSLYYCLQYGNYRRVEHVVTNGDYAVRNMLTAPLWSVPPGGRVSGNIYFDVYPYGSPGFVASIMLGGVRNGIKVQNILITDMSKAAIVGATNSIDLGLRSIIGDPVFQPDMTEVPVAQLPKPDPPKRFRGIGGVPNPFGKQALSWKPKTDRGYEKEA